MKQRVIIFGAAAGTLLLLLVAVAVGAALWFSRTGGPGDRSGGAEGERVQPAGVPYSYAIPPAWVRAIKDPQPGTLLTSVGPPPDADGHYTTEIVSVQVRNDDSSEEWRQSLERIYQQIKAGNGDKLGPGWTVRQITAPAGTAWEATYVDRQGISQGGRYVLFDQPAASPVLVMAQWLKDKDRQSALRGCDVVVGSLTIG